MTRQYMKTLTIVASAAVAAGCSTMAAETNSGYERSSSAPASSSVSAVDLKASQQRIAALESQLATTEKRLEMARDSGASSEADASLFPPNPKAGECYARVLIPARYDTVSEQVLVREAGERFEIIPARFEQAEENLLVKEASTRLEIIPAVYDEVQETILVKPASKQIVEVPAVYETVTERVLDKAAHTAWKKGPAAAQTSSVISQSTSDTGEIMCLVEVPATYKTVSKRVLASPARTEEITIPAEYKTVTKTVVVKPATTREVPIPAQYGNVKVTKLVSPAKEQRIAIPAQYETVTRTNKVMDEGLEWRRVVCEVNMTRDNVRTLQQALADEGFYKAQVDGIIGGQTLDAARKYAIQKNLPAGSNYIAVEVVKSLNITL